MDYRSFRKQDFKFWTNINTRWVDMDSLGHINNAIYLNYIETARLDFFSKIKMPDINKNLEESVILASIEIQYFSQLSHPCSLIIGHRISRIGVKSFDLLAGVFEKKGLGLSREICREDAIYESEYNIVIPKDKLFNVWHDMVIHAKWGEEGFLKLFVNGELKYSEIGYITPKFTVPNKKNKLIFDGYPRTISQAKNLDKLLVKSNQKINFIFFLNVEKNTIVERIKTRKPMAYILKEAWFNGSLYTVDERVIVPRSPIAELIQHSFEPWLNANSPKSILDLCTGSGCIAIECAKQFKTAKVDAVDISTDALFIAHQNNTLHKTEQQVTFYESDLFSALPDKKYDIIVSNPPYVANEGYEELSDEFLQEPKLALVSDNLGLDITYKILANAKSYLEPNGHLFVEVGESWPTLEQMRPDLPLTWIHFESGGEGVFYLNEKDIP